jgi:hypothetical protein
LIHTRCCISPTAKNHFGGFELAYSALKPNLENETCIFAEGATKKAQQKERNQGLKVGIFLVRPTTCTFLKHHPCTDLQLYLSFFYLSLWQLKA